MQLDYLDLVLLHQPFKDYHGAYRALIDLYKEGKIKAIGVSNFYPNILTNFCEIVKVKPVVNQVELHPYYTQEKALETMKYYNVVPEAWAPLGGGRYNPFEDEMLKMNIKNLFFSTWILKTLTTCLPLSILYMFLFEIYMFMSVTDYLNKKI